MTQSILRVSGVLAYPPEMADSIEAFILSRFGAWVRDRIKGSREAYKESLVEEAQRFEQGAYAKWGPRAEQYYLETTNRLRKSLQEYEVLDAFAKATGAKGPAPKKIPAKVEKTFKVNLRGLPTHYPVEKMTRVTSTVPVVLVFSDKSEGPFEAQWVYSPVANRRIEIFMPKVPHDVVDYKAWIKSLRSRLEHELRHMVQSLLGDALQDDPSTLQRGTPNTSEDSTPTDPETRYYLQPHEFYPWLGQAKTNLLESLSLSPKYLRQVLNNEDVEIQPTLDEFKAFVGDPKPTKPKLVSRGEITTHPFFAALWQYDRKRWQKAVSELYQDVFG